MPDMQAFHAFLSALGPNVLTMLGSLPPMHYAPPLQPPVVPPPPVNAVIDPQLQQPQESPLVLTQVLQWLQNLEESLKRPHNNEDSDADDEGDGGTKRHSKKPRKDSKFILNIKTSQLTPAQKTTRGELQVRTCDIL
jgi:hypothetical protein